MQVIIPGSWMGFCIAIGFLLITLFIMQLLGKFFVTKDVVLRNFTILDLQLASTELEIDNTLTGIKALGEKYSRKVIHSLKWHLYVDFLFMPSVYGALFIACMQLSTQVPRVGTVFFSLLAWLQIAAWLSNIIENGYLLSKIDRHFHGVDVKTGGAFFRYYQYLQVVKWGLSLLALVSVLSIMLYFWISGYYSPHSLKYISIVAAEALLFFVLVWVFRKTGRRWKAGLRA